MPAAVSDIRAGGAQVAIGGDDTPLVRALRGARGKLRGFVTAADKLGKKLMFAGVAMATPIALGLRAQARFSAEMANVSTMLSEADMSFLPIFSKRVAEFSVKFGEATGTIAKGLYDILSAGVEAKDALTVLEASLIAARAGVTDTGTAADALTTILKSFKIASDKAIDVSDLLFAVVKRGKTTFNELAPAIGMVAATASVSGLRLEEMGAMLATMTRNGVRTRIAVTALNSILSTFLRPTTDAQKAAKELGIELNTNTLRTEGLVGVLQKLQGATAETVAQVFNNRRALRGILPVVQDLTGYTFDLNLMTERAGMAQEAFEKQTKSLQYMLKRTRAAFVEFTRSIGEALEPAARKYGTQLLNIIQSTIKWVQANKQAIITYAKMTTAILATGAALLTLVASVKLLGFLMSPAGVAGVMLLSLLAISDAMGDIDLGLTNLIGDFELGGVKIKYYLVSAWEYIVTAWVRARDFIVQGLDSIVTSAELVWHSLQVGWNWLTGVLKEQFWKIAGAAIEMWDRIVYRAKKAWLDLKFMAKGETAELTRQYLRLAEDYRRFYLEERVRDYDDYIAKLRTQTNIEASIQEKYIADAIAARQKMQDEIVELAKAGPQAAADALAEEAKATREATKKRLETELKLVKDGWIERHDARAKAQETELASIKAQAKVAADALTDIEAKRTAERTAERRAAPWLATPEEARAWEAKQIAAAREGEIVAAAERISAGVGANLAGIITGTFSGRGAGILGEAGQRTLGDIVSESRKHTDLLRDIKDGIEDLDVEPGYAGG